METTERMSEIKAERDGKAQAPDGKDVRHVFFRQKDINNIF
jgi:hypothetical protein